MIANAAEVAGAVAGTLASPVASIVRRELSRRQLSQNEVCPSVSHEAVIDLTQRDDSTQFVHGLADD